METIDPKDSVQSEQFGKELPLAETTQETSATVLAETVHDETFEELVLTHPHDEADDDEVNFDPNNIDEIAAEAVEEGEAPAEDYSLCTKEELIQKLSALLSGKPLEKIRQSVESIKVNFYKKHKAELEKLRKEAEDAGEESTFVTEPDQFEERLKELLKKYRDLKAEFNQKIEAEKQNNLREKYRIIEEIKELVNRKEAIAETYHHFRDLQNQWRSIGLVPQQNIKDLWETYHHYVEIFYDFIKINNELRDLDLKKNLESKMVLCEKAEELLLEPSIIKAFKSLQKLHEQWREIGPVPQEMKVEIWERFKAITSKINKKHQDYFESLKQVQKKNLESKSILCERAEEISNVEIKGPKEWEQFYQEMVELQKIWRTIGFAPKKDNNRIYNRFRTACDNFFARKREFFAQNKEEQLNNLQLKTDLCVQAEALKESTDWKATTDDLINLQKKWKEIGSVSRKHSDQIWKRFRAACDYFFARKAAHYNNIDSQYDENYKLKLALIAEIEAFVPGDNTEDNFQKLKDFQRRWSEIGFVPLKFKEEVQKKYRETINRHFDNLKVDDARKNLMKFKNKIENMSGKHKGDRKILNERDKYINKLRQIENDIVVWENNIGFFAKSKNAEAMIAEVQRKIQQGKEEIKLLEQKVRMIDSMEDDE
ncbi:MAG: DUF349 domain-containing protein [Bacteroidota bacterium]|nr:DUF349 domain-containing protein [Bacteroidota bacterium]